MFRALVLLLVLLADSAAAHDPGMSSTAAVFDSLRRELVAEMQFPVQAVEGTSLPTLEVVVDGVPRPPLRVETLATAPADPRVRLTVAADGHRISLSVVGLSALHRGHRHFMRVEDGEGNRLSESLLDEDRPTLEFGTDNVASSTSAELIAFFATGVAHIAGGADHLLFLFALLIACPTWRATLRIVTTFTAAHSLTLIAGTVGWISLSPGVVEPLIAISVILAALLNLAPGGPGHSRLALTFLFGLVHGLGFSSALTGLGVGSGAAILVPLAGFNLGVEAGQLAFAALAVPIWRRVLKSLADSVSGVSWGSLLAAGAGCYWLVLRL